MAFPNYSSIIKFYKKRKKWPFIGQTEAKLTLLATTAQKLMAKWMVQLADCSRSTWLRYVNSTLATLTLPVGKNIIDQHSTSYFDSQANGKILFYMVDRLASQE